MVQEPGLSIQVMAGGLDKWGRAGYMDSLQEQTWNFHTYSLPWSREDPDLICQGMRGYPQLFLVSIVRMQASFC